MHLDGPIEAVWSHQTLSGPSKWSPHRAITVRYTHKAMNHPRSVKLTFSYLINFIKFLLYPPFFFVAFSRSGVAPIFEKHQLTSNHWIEALVRKGRTVPPSPDQSHGCLCSVGLPISEEDHIFKRMWNSVIWEVMFVGTVCFLLYLRCKENPTMRSEFDGYHAL